MSFFHNRRPAWLLRAGLLLALLGRGLLLSAQGFGPLFTPWPVPVGGSPTTGFAELGYLGISNGGPQGWGVLDLNGDQQPDLVVFSQYSNSISLVLGGLSAPYWRVYLGTAAGFAALPTTWAVPVGGSPAEGFNQFASNGSFLRSFQGWQMLDMDGDRRPDLVVFNEGNGSTRPVLGGVAAPYWRVYRNTGSGFSALPLNWPVPVGGAPATGFSQPASGGAVNAPSWETLDLNGDRRPDLVVFSQPNGTTVPTVLGGLSAPYWRVYLGTATGFAAAPLTWAVPVGGSPINGFYQLDYFGTRTLGHQGWTVQDMDADQRPDLVVLNQGNGTDNPVLGGPAAPYWRVYAGTATGFAAVPTTWAVPVGGLASVGFYHFWGGGSRVGEQGWEVLDMNGDQRPDLVVLNEGDGLRAPVLGGLRAPYWRVHLGTATGFAALPLTWPVPVGGSINVGINALVNRGSYQNGYQGWSVLDMNGDQRPDLVVASQGNGSVNVVLGGPAMPVWRVYQGAVLPTRAATAGAPALTVCPTPFHTDLTIEAPGASGQPYTVADGLGRVWATGRLPAERFSLPLERLPAGLYFLRLGGPAPRTVKVVKQ